MLFFAGLCLCAALYCITATALRIPAFKVSGAFRRSDKKKNMLISNMISVLSAKLAPIIPMNIVRKTKMEKILNAANSKQTPKGFMADTWVRALLPLPFTVIAALIHPLLAIAPLGLCWYMYNHRMEALKKQGERRRLEVEKEMPRFVAYMSNTLKTERNIISCIDTYIANYHTALTRELSITVADMRMGNAELALQRFETRSNSPFVSQLVRGLLSSMRGNDMTAYFENLSYTLTNAWEQRLRGQALRKQPKIERMSYILFGIAMITVFTVIIATLTSSASILGGM